MFRGKLYLGRNILRAQSLFMAGYVPLRGGQPQVFQTRLCLLGAFGVTQFILGHGELPHNQRTVQVRGKMLGGFFEIAVCECRVTAS